MARPALLEVLRKRVLLCDGGMGSRVQILPLDIEKDYWGKENCTDVLCLSRPDIVREDYMNELCVLQDDVPPFSDAQVR